MLKKSRLLVYILFCSAGFSSLIFQVIWQRELSIVFGGALHSTAVILSSCMAGLAIGAWIFGRIASKAENRLKLFAFLQFALAASGLLLIFISPLFESISRMVFPVFMENQSMYHFIVAMLAFLFLLVPTTVVGGMFPVLIAELGNSAGGLSVSRLYGANNIGAVAGSAICGFILVRTLGASSSAVIAAAVAILSGAAVFFIRGGSYKTEDGQTDEAEAENDIAPSHSKYLLKIIPMLFMFSGFTSLSYEIIYNRTITYFVGNNTYSFSILVSVFILGLALGSFLFSSAQKKKMKVSGLLWYFAAAEMLLAFYNIIMPLYSASLNNFLVSLRFSLGFDSMSALYLVKILGAVMTIFIPAVTFGFIYPLVFKMYFSLKKSSVSSKDAGFLTAINTAGTAAGPLVTGFIIIALAGLSGALRINSAINLAIAAAVVFFFVFAAKGARKKVKAALILALVFTAGSAFVFSTENRLAKAAALGTDDDRLIYYKEGVFGTVSVSKNSKGIKEIKINGVGEVPTDHDSMRAFRMLAHLPFTINDSPKSILSIAFGGGITFGSISLHDLPSAKCVEICKDVLGAAPLYDAENHGVYKNKKIKIEIMDGRKYISSTREKFDLITSDSTHPASYDSWILYTKEFYGACRAHLNKGGIFAQWVPLHDLSEQDFKTILKTYSSQFKHASLYLTNTYTVILGSDLPLEPKQANFDKITANPQIADELKKVNISSLADIEKCLLMKDEKLREYSADAVIAEDDSTPLQFTESRSFSRNTVSDNMKSFRFFINEGKDENSSYMAKYLQLASLNEDGSHAEVLSLFNSIPDADAEMFLVAKKAYDLKKNEMLSQKSLSRVFSERDPKVAVEMADELIQIFPKEGLPLCVKGFVLFTKMDDFDGAVKCYSEALILSPENPAVLNNAAKFYYNAGLFAKSLEVLRRLDSMSPDNEGIIYSMASNLIKMNMKSDAKKLIFSYREKSGNKDFAEDIIRAF